MKVIHSCTSESFSGLEQYVVDLATWQYKQGRDVEVFCREGSQIFEAARRNNVPVWTLPRGAWLGMREGWKRRLGADRPVVLHMHHAGELRFHFPWIAAARSNLKSILHFHLWINHEKKDPFHWLLYRGLSEVWCSSETYRAHLSTLLPVDRAKLRVVPYGRDVAKVRAAVTPQERRNWRERLGVPGSAFLFLTFSRLEPIKGVGELFDAFLKVAQAKADAWLAIVGDPSPNNAEAESFARELKARHAALPAMVRERVLLPGYLADSLGLYAAADAYVLPSYEECMSLALLDAAVAGLPLIGTQSGGTPSIVRPEETGYLVPPRESAPLAEAMQALAGRSALEKLGAASQQLGAGFDRERVFGDIWKAYQT